MEEANMYGDANPLDADARLPPRKRLLAGMKKQNCDCPSPSSPLSSVSSDISNRVRDLLNSNYNGSTMSAEDIVKASRSAALAAAKAAAAARAAAEEKAAVAAKAVAAAKTALELVARSTSGRRSRKERGLRKDKPKKHVPVKLLYKKRKRGDKGETDEELARRLHRVMNSSPRISKNPTSSDQKGLHKKHRKRLVFDKTVVKNGGSLLEGKPPSTCNMNVHAGDKVENVVELDDKASECTKTDILEANSLNVNGDTETSPSSVQVLEDTVLTSRKRGRIKQKKLSLSLCAVRDRENTKEEPKSRGLQSVKESKGKPSATDDPLSTVKPSPEVDVSNEAVSTWQRKELSAAQCYAGSNILGSLCSNPTVTTGSAMVEVDH